MSEEVLPRFCCHAAGRVTPVVTPVKNWYGHHCRHTGYSENKLSVQIISQAWGRVTTSNHFSEQPRRLWQQIHWEIHDRWWACLKKFCPVLLTRRRKSHTSCDAGEKWVWSPLSNQRLFRQQAHSPHHFTSLKQGHYFKPLSRAISEAVAK